MGNPTIDFTDTIAKYNAAYAKTVRVPEAVRVQMAGAIAAERDRLSAELRRTKPAPVPALTRHRPNKGRTPSLTKVVREANKAGLSVAGATFTADGSISLSFGETTKTNGNDLDQWLAGRHENSTEGH